MVGRSIRRRSGNTDLFDRTALELLDNALESAELLALGIGVVEAGPLVRDEEDLVVVQLVIVLDHEPVRKEVLVSPQCGHAHQIFRSKDVHRVVHHDT